MVTKRRLITLSLCVVLVATTISAFVHPKVLVRANDQRYAATSCGVTRTGTGYTFQWLHTANGNIVASSGCIINLKGFNLPGVGYGNAIGSGNPQVLNKDVTWFAQTFHMNLWRVLLNAVWWNQDVAVPDAGMHYRAWIQQIVQWLESNGNYVLLTKGPQFHELPCGGSITYCPAQNQASIDIKKNPSNPVYQHQLTTGQYIDDAVMMWNGIAKLYVNDPAVLYDSWNEMHGISAQTWQNSENALISAIRAQNPRSLIFLGGPHYENGFSELIKGQVPAFTQTNLVYDFHAYSGYVGTYQGKTCQEPLSQVWANWPQNANIQVTYAQQHGAASFSEWGGCYDSEPYNKDITTYASSHHIVLAYYAMNEVFNRVRTGYQLNYNGLKAQAVYAAIS